MAGTLLLTGANGSLAIPAVDRLLSKYPDYTAVLTVRNTTDADQNTKKLRATIARYPRAKASIRALDLSNLAEVETFASTLAAEIADGKLPSLTSIVCNAYYWNLKTAAERTDDGLDRTLQVNHVAHVALVMRLLGSFSPAAGRVVFLSSDTHEPGKSPLEKIRPSLPDDLEELNRPDAKGDTDKQGQGFWRYSVSKLAILAFTHALNRRLEKVRKYNTSNEMSYNQWLTSRPLVD